MNGQNIPSNIRAAIRLVAAAIRRIQEQQTASPPPIPTEKKAGTGCNKNPVVSFQPPAFER